MRRLIEFPLEDGSRVVAEVDEPDARASIKRGDRLQESVEKAGQTFEAALDQIKPAAAVLISKFRAIHDAPAEVQVEFGLKLSAAAGALIASTSAEANFRVTLTWKCAEQKLPAPSAAQA